MKARQNKGNKDSTKPVPTPVDAHHFLFEPKWVGIGVFILAFLLYANTLFFGFVQDDAIVITDNMYTTNGVSGIPGILSKDTFFGFFKESGKEALVSGGRYRPFSLVLFAFVHQVFGGNPFPFHLMTIVLYAATCWLLYYCFLRLLKDDNTTTSDLGNTALIALIGAVLFTVHPVHTEVVANIKGCDEILSLLGSIGALYLALLAYDYKKNGLVWLAGLVFFMGLMSKENAFMFIFIVPLAFWMFRTQDIGSIIKHNLGIFAATLLFFVIRGSIIGWKSFGGTPMELMNNPYLKYSGGKWVFFETSEKFATIFYTFGQYLKLLFVPTVLTHDYYPRHIDIMQMGNVGVILSIAVLIFFLVFAFKNLQAQRPLRFGILLFLITLFVVSNLIFPIGTNMGERFIFMPSAGFALALAAILASFTQNMKVPLVIAGALVLLFSIKTISRNTAWESNEKLFLTDVQVSERSAKLQNSCGGALYEKSLKITDPIEKKRTLEKSVIHLKKALEIHPTYKNAYLLKANAEFYLEQYEDCIKDYQTALQIDPNYKDAKKNLAIALRDAGKYEGEKKGNIPKALDYLNQSIQLDKNDTETLRLLGVANGVSGNHTVAIQWFNKAVEAAPQNAMLWYDLSMAYKYINETQKSNEALQKALQLDPKLLENLSKRK